MQDWVCLQNKTISARNNWVLSETELFFLLSIANGRFPWQGKIDDGLSNFDQQQHTKTYITLLKGENGGGDLTFII